MNIKVFIFTAIFFLAAIVPLSASFYSDLVEYQARVADATNSNDRIGAIISLLSWLQTQNPGPASIAAKECYYADSTFWNTNLFMFVRENFERALREGSVDARLLAQLQPIIMDFEPIFNPISDLSSMVKHSPSDFEKPLSGFGSSKLDSSASSSLALVVKNPGGSTAQISMDERAYDECLQWIGWMFARAGWAAPSFSVKSMVDAGMLRSSGFPAGGVYAKWAHGDSFTLSLTGSALEIFIQLEPFLDWLSHALIDELGYAREAILVVSSSLSSNLLKLEARKKSMRLLYDAVKRAHQVVASVGIDEE